MAVLGEAGARDAAPLIARELRSEFPLVRQRAQSALHRACRGPASPSSGAAALAACETSPGPPVPRLSTPSLVRRGSGGLNGSPGRADARVVQGRPSPPTPRALVMGPSALTLGTGRCGVVRPAHAGGGVPLGDRLGASADGWRGDVHGWRTMYKIFAKTPRSPSGPMESRCKRRAPKPSSRGTRWHRPGGIRCAGSSSSSERERALYVVVPHRFRGNRRPGHRTSRGALASPRRPLLWT